MELLFQKLGGASTDPSEPIKVDHLLALADKYRLTVPADRVAPTGSSLGKGPSATGAASAPKAAASGTSGSGEKDAGTAAEVVKIHTM